MSAPSTLDAVREGLLDLERIGRDGAHRAPGRTAGAADERAVLELGGEAVCVPMARVEALLRAPAVVPVPGASSDVLGAVRHGRRMVAVIDPHAAGVSAPVAPAPETLVVLGLDRGCVALPVDAVHGLADGDTARVPALDLDALERRW